jgi:hypothetical protein
MKQKDAHTSRWHVPAKRETLASSSVVVRKTSSCLLISVLASNQVQAEANLPMRERAATRESEG